MEVMDEDFVEEPVKVIEKNKVAMKDSATKYGQRKESICEKHKTSKRQRDKSKELPSKRRKRIIERNSSDSDGKNIFFILSTF